MEQSYIDFIRMMMDARNIIITQWQTNVSKTINKQNNHKFCT